MAYSPSEKYPGAVDSDPNYKGGKFRDNNPSTTNNGSPLKAIDRNELLARDEAIMNDAGFDYNGLPDTPQDSQLFKAYKASLGNGANLLSNHNFLIPSPDDSQPAPSATPTSYPPGYQIFSGVFANETTGISNLTYIDGRVSFSGGDLYFAVPNTGGLERLTADQFVASVADFDGKPRTRGVSFALVGDEYRVTVGIDALEDESANETLLGSVKFEQGKVATGHDVQSSKGQIYNFDSVAQAIFNCPSIGSSIAIEDYYGGSNSNNSGVLFFKVVPAGSGIADGGKYIDVDATRQLEQNMRLPVDITSYGAMQGNNPSLEVTNNTAITSAIAYVSSIGVGDVYVPNYEFYCSDIRLLQEVSMRVDGKLLLGGTGKVLIRPASYSRVYGSGALREVSGGSNTLVMLDTSIPGYQQIRSPEIDIRCESYNQDTSNPDFGTSRAIELLASNALGTNSFIWLCRIGSIDFIGGFENSIRITNIDHSVPSNSWIHDTKVGDIKSEYGGGTVIKAAYCNNLFIYRCVHQYWSGAVGTPVYDLNFVNNSHFEDGSSWDRPDAAFLLRNCNIVRIEGNLINSKNESAIVDQVNCTDVKFWNTRWGDLYTDYVYKRAGLIARNGMVLGIAPSTTNALFTVAGGFNGTKSRLKISAVTSLNESVDIVALIAISGTTRQLFVQSVTGYSGSSESTGVAQKFAYSIEGENISIGYAASAGASVWVSYEARLMETIDESITNLSLLNPSHSGGAWVPFG